MTSNQYLISKINKLQSSQRLDKALVKLFPNISRSNIKTWIINNLVKVNNKIINKPKTKVTGGELVEIKPILKEILSHKAQNININIIYEDHDIIIINKPKGLVVHPGINNIDGTLLNALLYYYPPIINVPRSGIFHRLDKDTTGLMIVAKNIAAQIQLTKALKNRKIIREYQAVSVGNIMTSGTIKQPIARHVSKRTHMAVRAMGKLAITHYRVIARFIAHTQLSLRLETGRTHQIRVHMAHIRHPLVGDPLYGGRLKLPKKSSDALKRILCCFNRQALHASLLQFNHPINFNKMEFQAPLPRDMITLLTSLKLNDEQFNIK